MLLLFLFFFFFFFFSSRRRHTRSLCDWSSDVCSSDLGAARDGPTPRCPTAPTVAPSLNCLWVLAVLALGGPRRLPWSSSCWYPWSVRAPWSSSDLVGGPPDGGPGSWWVLRQFWVGRSSKGEGS